VAHPDPAVPSRSLVRRRLVLRVLLAAAVVGIIYFRLLPKQVDVAEVWATLRAMTWLELVTLSAAAVWNLGSYLLPQLVALPSLSLRQAALESHTSTAVGNPAAGRPSGRTGRDLALLLLPRASPSAYERRRQRGGRRGCLRARHGGGAWRRVRPLPDRPDGRAAAPMSQPETTSATMNEGTPVTASTHRCADRSSPSCQCHPLTLLLPIDPVAG
jgi:hypothetical protein